MADFCNVLMIYPKFNANSFWNYQATCEMVGAKYPAGPLGLITVAAMLPSSWVVRLVDRNAEDVHETDFAWADMIMTGGMLAQQRDTLAIIDLAHVMGKPVVVGGPGVTSTPDAYNSADFQVLGEAEGILDQFNAAWREGKRSGSFAANKFEVDVTQSPTPRYDLVKFKNYLHVGVQFSRGCPFVCEFCDIIELYGRVPRTKTIEQVLGELDRLYGLGYRGHVDFVDDNLVGNKKALQAFLPHLQAWQTRHRYPFEFSTEASINLADDATLLKQLRDANFLAVFIGLESADEATLIQAQKKQNTRRDVAACVHRFYEAGMFVLAGFIIGFDSETSSVAKPMMKLIEDAQIPVVMLGLLYALPNTQLTRRLEREHRLFAEEESADDETVYGDQCTAGLNFITRRPRQDILDDYRVILNQVYSPAAYFARVWHVGNSLKLSGRPQSTSFEDLWRFVRLMSGVSLHHPDLRWRVWRLFFSTILHNPRALPPVLRLVALYFHLGPFSRYVINEINTQIKALERGCVRAGEVSPEKAARGLDYGLLY